MKGYDRVLYMLKNADTCSELSNYEHKTSYKSHIKVESSTHWVREKTIYLLQYLIWRIYYKMTGYGSMGSFMLQILIKLIGKMKPVMIWKSWKDFSLDYKLSKQSKKV